MSNKLYTSQKLITASFSTNSMPMAEVLTNPVKDTNNCLKATKKDLHAKTVNADNIEDLAEDGINEDETNVVHESDIESGINSTGEIKQAKSVSEIDSLTGKVEERVNVAGKKKNEINASKNENRKPTDGSTYSIAVGGDNRRYDMDNKLTRAWAELKIEDNHNKEEKSLAEKIGWFALKTAAMSGVILGGTALIVPALGFGAAGVTAGSLAAAYQSAFLGGTIASGSTFAVLQSIGAAGLSSAATSSVVAGSAVVSGAHSLIKNNKKSSK